MAEEDTNAKRSATTNTGIGIALGAGIGIIFGQAIFDNPGVGLIFGAGIGLVLGAAYGHQKDNPKAQNDTNDSE